MVSTPPITDARAQTAALLRSLLPRTYWNADADPADGGTLAALVDALAAEYLTLRNEVEALYDAMFVETCPPDVLPYIGWNIGLHGISPLLGPGVSNRAWVGRTIRFRRQKGTLSALERALAAASGWTVSVFEEQAHLGRAQSMSALTPQLGRLASISGRAGTVAPSARLAAVSGRNPGGAARPDDPGTGPMPGVVGVEIWRLAAYGVTGQTPFRVAGVAGGRAFTFHPAGVDSPLFQLPRTPSSDPQPAVTGSSAVAQPLSIAGLQALLDNPGRDRRALRVQASGADGATTEVALVARDLRDWDGPGDGGQAVIVDPVLGRLLFPDPPPAGLSVDHAYGFSGEIGGGPYGVASSWSLPPAGTVTYAVVGAVAEADNGSGSLRFDQVLALPWPGARQAVIEDSATRTAPAGGWDVTVGKGGWLRIASAPQSYPLLAGDLHFHLRDDAAVELSGLMVAGKVSVEGAGTLHVEHCTLVPGDRPSLVTTAGLPVASVSVSYCIAGPIEAGAGTQLAVDNSFVVGAPTNGGHAIGAPHRPVPRLDMRAVTVFGTTDAAVITARSSIFTGRLDVTQPRSGLVGYCYLAPGSTPPAAAVECVAGDRALLRPRFTSRRYGDPGFGQLHDLTPDAIARGGPLGREMGAFESLAQPERSDRVPLVIADLLPAGVSARLHYRS